MNDPTANAGFVERLLKQETQVSDEQLVAYRRRLDERLARAQRRERSMRIATVVVWTVSLGCFGSLFVMALVDRHGVALQKLTALPDFVLIGGWVAILTSFICAVPFLLLYILHYRRGVDQARQELRDMVLADLQRKINGLVHQPETRAPALTQPPSKTDGVAGSG